MMKATERHFGDVTGSSENRVAPNLVSVQLSYSTADIERGIFFGAQGSAVQPAEQLGKATILVVHGEMFQLEETPLPQAAVPLTEQSGLFDIVGIAEQHPQ